MEWQTAIPRRASTVSSTVPENPALDREAKSLEEILRNQSRPENLVAVTQDRTPVLQSPSSDAKVLFLASAEDEFEILDLNSEWVHVRISGLARGWLRRAMVETLDPSKDPESTPAADPRREQQQTDQATDGIFSISGEQLGSFPGDWAPLKGKNVHIISVRHTSPTARTTSPEEKMRFAESKLKKQNPSSEPIGGVVLIFDTEDGGIVAVPRPALEQWKAGFYRISGSGANAISIPRRFWETVSSVLPHPYRIPLLIAQNQCFRTSDHLTGEHHLGVALFDL
jgi:hypothetical protein